MRVFNLTDQPLDFRGKILPANGGFLDFVELNTFIPSRDKDLSKSGVISFGSLPSWWKPKTTDSPPVRIAVSDVVAVTDAVSVSEEKHEAKPEKQEKPWKKR